MLPADCELHVYLQMFSSYKSPHEVHGNKHHDPLPMHTDGQPSGRLGGPCVLLLRRPDDMLASAGTESYNAFAPYGETLNRLRRTLSQRGFEIMRECDLGPRLRTACGGSETQCRILYVTEPELLATAISTHASAALWLPIPVVVCEREEYVTILLPAEAIVRDRAALLGLRAMVERSYELLTEAVRNAGASDARGELE
jgi:uncharacterized protein (DUF302 family)